VLGPIHPQIYFNGTAIKLTFDIYQSAPTFISDDDIASIYLNLIIAHEVLGDSAFVIFDAVETE
jgi:hypothetical protein